MKCSLLTIALAAGLALNGSAFAQETDRKPVGIGFVAALSGSLAGLGQDQYDGFMLAVNREGGKLGGIPVSVHKEDDQLKPDVANQIVQRLIDREGVSIITGITGSNVMMAIAKPAAEKKVVVIGSNASPSPLAGDQCNPYFFTMAPQGDQKAEVVGQYATDQGYKKAYLLAPNYQAGKDVLGGFKRKFKGEVVDEVYTPLDQLDFSVELAQLAAAAPDVVYAFYPGSLGVNFVRQYHQAGLSALIPLVSTALVDGVQLPALKQAALGIKTGAFWGYDIENGPNETFVEEFRKTYGRLPSEYAAQSYDAALLIGAALEALGGDVTDKAKLIDTLASASFESVRGPLKFNTNHFPIHDMHMFEVVKAETGDDVVLRKIATPLTAAADAYVGKCKMPQP